MLSHQQARRAYDRIGALQDSQAFYEDRATGELLLHADFASATRVFEFGCGTGRFAQRLLAQYLPPTAHYRGCDLSSTMVGLARQRLAPYGARAEVALTEGAPPVDEPTAVSDRFVSTYVLDLLSEDDIRAVLGEAHRMLRPGGLLCLTSLSTPEGLASRILMSAWGWVHALQPALVGGCRPIALLPFLDAPQWRVRHHAKVVTYAIPSEVIVAERR